MGIKISELQELSNLKDDDVLVIVDSNGNATRKIKYSDIKNKIGVEGVKGAYESLEELKADNPDHSNIYAVLNENSWYYWNEGYNEEEVGSESWLCGGEYPINLKEFSQKVNKKSVIQVANSGSITYEASMSKTLFPFQKNLLEVGDAFELISNRIRLKKDIKCVRFDLLLRYSLINNTQNYGFSVIHVRNNQTVKYTEVTQTLSRSWDAVKLSGYFSDLKVGDFIQVEWFQSSVGAIVSDGQPSNCFTVSEI